MNIRNFHSNLIQKLSASGILCPENEAEQILLESLEKDRLWLFLNQKEEMPEKALKKAENLLNLRLSKKPLQYILGKAYFMGLCFFVDENVLIPRQDTELIAETAEKWILENKAKSALDLCTGSGALAVSLKTLFPNLKVTASDISKKAIEIAKKNALSNNCQDLTFVTSDLFSEIFENFDIIVTNPPYIPNWEIPTLQREVRDFEPHLALDGGDDGLVLIRKILEEAPLHLNDNGLILMEIGSSQSKEVLSIAKNLGLYREFSIEKDLNGLDRMFRAVI